MKVRFFALGEKSLEQSLFPQKKLWFDFREHFKRMKVNFPKYFIWDSNMFFKKINYHFCVMNYYFVFESPFMRMGGIFFPLSGQSSRSD